MENFTTSINLKSLCLATVLTLLNFVNLNAQTTLAADNASNYDTTGWIYNSNGGYGMTPWMIWTNGDTDNGTAGHAISSSAANGFGNVDVAGKAFSMYGHPFQGNPQAVGYRWFTNTGAQPDVNNGNRTPLLAGQVFKIDIAVALRNGYKGIDLLTTDGQFLWNFGVDNNRYQTNQEVLFGNVYQQNSVFHIRAEQITNATFRVIITRNNEVYTSSVFTGQIGGMKFYESSTASADVLNKLYFNNLEVVKCANETTWNGTSWSNGIPQTGVRAIISGNYTSTGNISACTLTVNNGARVTITEGTTLTVENEITVSSNSQLIIESNANLVQTDNNAVNQGNIIVKRNSSSLYRLDYTLWSSPVSGQQLQAFSPSTASNRFYEYAYITDTTTGEGAEYYAAIDASATNFEKGKSYLIRMPNVDPSTPGYLAGTTAITFQGIFTGIPTNGILTKELSTQGNRYTAVGNPYASAINVQDFFDANSDVLDASAGLYFWRKKNDTNASSYATLSKDAYVYNHATGGAGDEEQFGGEQWDALFNVTPSQNWVINPGQGFFVKTAEGVVNPKLIFNNAMRRGDVHNNQFFRTAQQDDQKSRMWLNMAGNDAFSQTAIVYSATATTGLDYGRDSKQLTSGTVAFYSIAQATNLTIQARPAFQDNDVVAMGYSTSIAGTYTISLHRKDGVFTEGQAIYVKDNVTGTTTDITDSGYTFTTEAGRFNNRFEVVYTTQALGTNTPQLNTNAVIVYKEGSSINITAGTAQIKEVTVYDIQGRKLYNQNGINTTSSTIKGLQAAQEIVIVEVSTDKGTVSKKIAY